jgi:hypothetical protein
MRGRFPAIWILGIAMTGICTHASVHARPVSTHKAMAKRESLPAEQAPPEPVRQRSPATSRPVPASHTAPAHAGERVSIVVESHGPVIHEVPPPVGPEFVNSSCDGMAEACPTCCDPFSCNIPSYWASADFLFWWTKEMDVPPLATSSPLGTAQAQAGVLGQPGTAIVFGNTGLQDQGRPGGRFTLGLWLDRNHCQSLDVTYLMLPRDTESASFSSNQFPILARPFFNVFNGAEDARRIAFPGELQGTLGIETSTELQSFEALYRLSINRWCNERTDLLLGYRFAELEDRIRISESTLALAAPLAGTTFDLFDEFNTRNTFHGVEAGLEMQCQNACWSWAALAKVAVGTTDSRTNISGQTITTVPGAAPAVAQAGLLALPTNIGTFDQSETGALWEFGLTLRRQLNCGFTANLGYTCLIWTGVARAGEQIDLGINTTQVPPGVLIGAARPAFDFDMTNYWAQGLRVGLEYSY